MGCVAEEARGPAEDGATATIAVPLIHATSEASYRLSGHVQVTEADGTVHDLDATGDQPQALLAISPGIHRVELLPGWTLERSYDGTTYVPVSALIGSTNPVDLVTPANQVTSWNIDFLLRDGASVFVVTFGVLERPQQLTAILHIQQAYDDYAPYLGETVDVELYLRASTQAFIDAQGRQARSFRASSFAAEVFDDLHGPLSTLLGKLAGGSLSFNLTHYSEGVGSFDGSVVSAGFPQLLFNFGDASFPVDASGFPGASAFVASNASFQIWADGEHWLSGVLTVGTYRGE